MLCGFEVTFYLIIMCDMVMVTVGGHSGAWAFMTGTLGSWVL